MIIQPLWFAVRTKPDSLPEPAQKNPIIPMSSLQPLTDPYTLQYRRPCLDLDAVKAGWTLLEAHASVYRPLETSYRLSHVYNCVTPIVPPAV